MSALVDAIAELERRVEQLEQRIARETPAPDRLMLLNLPQAADRLGMSLTFIRDAIRDGRLPATKLGRSVRIAIADVDALPSRVRRRDRDSPATPRDRAARIKIGGQ